MLDVLKGIWISFQFASGTAHGRNAAQFVALYRFFHCTDDTNDNCSLCWHKHTQIKEIKLNVFFY